MTESGKGTALITGANRGIGEAIAVQLASAGYDLALLARDEQALAGVAAQCKELGARTISLCGELADEAFMDQAVAGVEEEFGGIDVLVNNAGTASNEAVQDADLNRWRQVMDVNFHALVYLCHRVLPAMVQRSRGTIINISSLSGRNTSAGSAIYSASKHAVNGFSGCMFEDVRDYGIKVSTIMPGFVETTLTAGLGLNAKHMIQPGDVAAAVEYVLSASAHCCPAEIVLRPQLRP